MKKKIDWDKVLWVCLSLFNVTISLIYAFKNQFDRASYHLIFALVFLIIMFLTDLRDDIYKISNNVKDLDHKDDGK